MADELIDILDEFGNVIGQKLKSEAHKKGLFHKAIHALAYDPVSDSVVIQKRCSDKDLYPSHWDITVGGHVGAGEDCAKTVQREIEEEIGFKVNIEQIKYMWTVREDLIWKDIHSREFVHCYLVTIPDIKIEDLKYQKEEVEQAKIVKMKDFFKLLKTEKFLPHTEEFKRWEAYFSSQNQF